MLSSSDRAEIVHTLRGEGDEDMARRRELADALEAEPEMERTHALVPVAVLEDCARLADEENETICAGIGLDPGHISGEVDRREEDAAEIDAANAADVLAQSLRAAARGEHVEWPS